jgi:hypothetical protein
MFLRRVLSDIRALLVVWVYRCPSQECGASLSVCEDGYVECAVLREGMLVN